ncbi:MAG: hypothetical protein ACRD1L_08080, partial [Terriglobales bacterium]
LELHQVTASGRVADAVISPDGKFLALVDLTAQGASLHLRSIVNGSDSEVMPPAPGCCRSPSFSADGSTIAFLEDRVLKSVPVLGGTTQTISASACSGAGFSADGSAIAYLVPQQSGTSLVVARADGSDAHVLAQSPAGWGFNSQCWSAGGSGSHAPSWSPNGRWIAVAESVGSGDGHIAVIAAGDGRSRDLGPNVGLAGSDAAWLPGGDTLIFTAAIPAAAGSQLWEVSFPGGQARQLTADLGGYASASVSAQGVAALVHRDPRYSIWAQAAPGGPFHELPEAGAAQDGRRGIAWTPQGGLVSVRLLGAQPQIWAEDSDGRHAEALVATAPTGARDVQVAPSGQIVFAGGRPATIWRANADGSGVLELLRPPAAGIHPALLQGGRAVVYMNTQIKGGQPLDAIPLAGGQPQRVSSEFIYTAGSPTSPDGTRIFAVKQGATPGSHEAIILQIEQGVWRETRIGLDSKTMHPPYGWTADGKPLPMS